MGAIAEKLLSELDKLAKQTSDKETLKEIAKMHVRLQRGSLKGKIRPGPLTYEEKEEALLELFKEKGWDPSWVKESIRKRKEAGLK